MSIDTLRVSYASLAFAIYARSPSQTAVGYADCYHNFKDGGDPTSDRNPVSILQRGYGTSYVLVSG